MALHALALLSQADEGYSSAYIASSVNTGAPFLRRLLSTLAKEGFVEAREGREGGYRLARQADRITLAEVYQAISPEPVLDPYSAQPNPLCPVGSGMTQAFADLTEAVDAAFLASLKGRTIADIAASAVSYGITGRKEAEIPLQR